MKDNETKIFINHIDGYFPSDYLNITEEDQKKFLDALANAPEANKALRDLMSPMYQMIADEKELKWFFDHVIQRPQVNESYSAVFVSRHKKLTKEEQETFGLTRKEGEFLATQTFRMRNVKEGSKADDPALWTFEQFLARVKKFNVDKGAYTTGTGAPIPTKTLAVIFYVNPGDDMKVCKKFVEEYMDVNEAISKAMLNGKTTDNNYQSYQWFGNAESTIKHLKANQKGSRYWMDFDIDVPKWFKEGDLVGYRAATRDFSYWPDIEDEEVEARRVAAWEHAKEVYFGKYYRELTDLFADKFGKGNYVIVDTSGGYHILVRTSAIKMNPHDICKFVTNIYKEGVADGNPEYLDDKGQCKFECIVNDSQIPGLPLPGTYQYDRPVTVLNKEDFEKDDYDMPGLGAIGLLDD